MYNGKTVKSIWAQHDCPIILAGWRPVGPLGAQKRISGAQDQGSPPGHFDVRGSITTAGRTEGV